MHQLLQVKLVKAGLHAAANELERHCPNQQAGIDAAALVVKRWLAGGLHHTANPLTWPSAKAQTPP